MPELAKSPLRDETRLRVLRLLEENPDLTQRQIAEHLGVSLGGINYCLRALIEKGWVKAENFAHSKKKLRYVYELTPSGLAAKTRLTSSFLKRKLAEYEALQSEIADLRRELGVRE